MKFTTAIKHNGLVQKILGTNFWQVKESFKWEVIYGDKDTNIIVNQGFITNFGSIPPLLRVFLNPTKYISYILHDKLYTEGKYTRKQADLILFEALKVEGAWLFTRFLIYLGVRIGGASHFKN